MDYRIERDSMGEVEVPSDRYWGAQTERSRRNFAIGDELMPPKIVRALALVKLAAAKANRVLVPDKMTDRKLDAISAACREILSGQLDGHFPLTVWQTGSGTQTNMNVNEVIANRGNEISGQKLLHPNDDVNMSQSSNDAFPSAMHIAAVTAIEDSLLPALGGLAETFRQLETENEDVVKCGRTHLQDAVPIRFSQEISAWRCMLESDSDMITCAIRGLFDLALGGTAVGTGLNAPAGFDTVAAGYISELTGKSFRAAKNKFEALSSKNALAFAHGALKALASDFMKIANDVRWLASGPRMGLGEIAIPSNEPGSSIMPGKVNPTQAEAATMVAVQVMGNDVSVGMAASQGNFQLNVFMPVLIFNFLQSCDLLSGALTSFRTNCAAGIKANREKMRSNLTSSLMNATALSPLIGYEKAAIIVQKAHNENLTLRESCAALGFLSPEEFDEAFHPEEMA